MKHFQRIVETLKLDVNLNRSTGEALEELARKAHLLDGTYTRILDIWILLTKPLKPAF